MKFKRRSFSKLRKMEKRGFRGYPVATLIFYGPTDALATKAAVGIVTVEGEEPETMKTWTTADRDIREDLDIAEEISEFINSQGGKSVVMMPGVFGCPHEEGIDYPEGESCPECPYWAGRDRVTKERVQ